jgi:hypothetical protein
MRADPLHGEENGCTGALFALAVRRDSSDHHHIWKGESETHAMLCGSMGKGSCVTGYDH